MYISTELMIKVAVFATAVSFVLAAMLPVLYPYTTDGDDSYADLASQRAGLTQYTGMSMINQAPYTLTGVYTPYVPGQSVNEHSFTADGWLYGTSVDYQPYLDQYKEIRLDPNQKSDTALHTANYTVSYMKTFTNTWAEETNDLWQGFVNSVQYWVFHDIMGESEQYKKQVTHGADYWVYSGYRYVFEPTIAVQAGVDSTKSVTLSIVWYQILGTEGISGGLNIYNEHTRTLLANYTMDEIIGDYDVNSGYATNYTLNFNGVPITMSIRFDATVLDGTMTLESAWKNGFWTCAFTSPSVAGLVDVDTGSFDMNLGSLLSTYTQVLTLSYPTIGTPWDIILFLLCSLPLSFLLLEVGMQVLSVIISRFLP